MEYADLKYNVKNKAKLIIPFVDNSFKEFEIKKDYWTSEELIIFINSIKETDIQFKWYVLITLYGDLRQCETLGLYTSDYIEENNCIKNYKTITNKLGNGKKEYYATKTRKNKLIYLPEYLKSDFKEYIRKIKKQKELIKLSPTTIARRFDYYIELNNLVRITPYKLRKSFSTLLLNNGVEKDIIRQFLGHTKNSTIAEKHYLEVYDDKKKEIVEEMSLLLCNNNKK